MKIMHLQITGERTDDPAIYRRQYRLHNQYYSLWSLGKNLLRIKRSLKFTFVRDPYVRCLSMFRDKVERGDNQKYRAVPGFGIQGREGFRTFVRFLQGGGTAHDDHFLPQVRSLPFPEAELDFVGKLENFRDEFLSFLRLANIQPSERVLEMVSQRANTKHVTFSEDFLRDYYDDEMKAIVREIYDDDFVAFRFKDSLPV